MNVNFILKVEDAKLTDVQKVLKDAGIKVRSIQEVYKEKTEEKAEEETDAGQG